MSLVKKKFSLDNYIIYDKVIDNRTLNQLEDYRNIIQSAKFEYEQILNQAQIDKQQILDEANQEAQEILYNAQQQANENLEANTKNVEKMLQVANEQVEDIIKNSEQRTSDLVLDQAKDLLDSLNEAKQQFYTHTFELINDTLKLIIKKLTTNLDVQDKMHVIVNQVFDKAKEVSEAILYFNPEDFENLPKLHIPQTWKIDKDITMDKGWCRLVGAGGEWKTSISLVERKLLESLNLDNNKE